MSELEQKCCPVHPHRMAITRCETCFKPLCEECRLQESGHSFCSPTCATNFFRNEQLMADLEARDALRRRRERIRQIILFILLIFISWLVYHFVLHPPSWAIQKKQHSPSPEKLK